MLSKSDVYSVKRFYDAAKRNADESKAKGDWSMWAIYATQASTIDATASMLGVFIDTGTGQ